MKDSRFNFRKIFIFLLANLLSHNVLATCYVAKNFKGTGYASVNGYSAEKDGMLGKVFHININKTEASVVPDPGTSCLPMSDIIMVCTGGIDDEITNMEIYSIDKRQKKVVYVQIRNGLEAALLSDLNGGKIFIGDIIGTCNK